MNILNNTNINILDLPDEILRTIFNKLNMVDILYSLVDVNQRFDRLALDSLYIHHLDLVIKRDDIHNSSVDTHIIERICSKILPRINDKVTKFILEPLSVKRVLGTIHYPQLYSDEFYLISSVILLVSKYLSDLTYRQKSSEKYITILPSNISYTHCLSSTLTKLTINVNTFYDYLYLLNGCLQSLSTSIIRISKINRSSSMIDNTKKLVKLKCFSLITDYGAHVIMTNKFSKTYICTYIDGNQLFDKVLNYMPRLNKFIFSINTYIINDDIGIDRPSNDDDIRNSFTERGIQSFDICFDDKFMNNRGNCHVYSLPYQFNEFLYMSNCFQGGRFDTVRLLSMIDKRPFEHKLFQIISQDFHFLRQLIMRNDIPQKNEQHHSCTLITFNHLLTLDILSVHNDYVIQFLSDKITRLPCLTNLIIEYETLTRMTNYFTNDTTRLNCAKIKSLATFELLVPLEHFYSYFPSL
ncbi:unnamed protein product [Rotaria magnacalcarata]|uniref:F-box domain-containing protein n=1 Tax=Rotaria magnacalcarata TaxID=392030 RepID=A0A816Q299_9BILA|nr:unnamed protein product [Rotaria magnacalcarata]